MNKNTITDLAHTSRLFKKTLLVSAVLSAFSATTLQAQETEANEADDESIERIFVTASKRQTGLQQTPIAVTVTSGETIEQAKVQDISDLQTLVPTLRVAVLQRSTNATFSIRGFGNGANNVGIEPSVGIFIDGVYRSRAGSSIGDLPKLQQVEVLSGPQSTLFGKNASAGVISVRTESPSYDMEGRVEAGVGNYNQRTLKGYITDGLSDNVAYSLSANMNTRDGFTESVSGLSNLNDRDRWGLRGQLLYEPNNAVTVRFIADYSEVDEVCCTVADVVNGPTTGAVQFLGGTVLDTADPFAYESALNTDPQSSVEDGGFSLQTDIDFENFAFTSITAMRVNDTLYGGENGNDVDYTSLDILRNAGHTEIDTFTQEFRLTSTGDRTLDWMLGAFIFQEEVATGDTLTYGTGVRPFFDVLLGSLPGILGTVESLVVDVNPGDFFANDTKINTEFTQSNDAYSLFANFDYKVSDKLTATFGLSYTNDEKEVTVLQPTNTDVIASFDFATVGSVLGIPFSSIPTLAPLIPTLQSFQFVPQNLDLPNSVEINKTSDSKVTWSTRLAYKLNKNVNFFATAATGFKATSWNLTRDTRPFASSQAALTSAGLTQPNQTYGTRFASPEDATVYEMGMKTRYKKGAFNVTVFDQTIEGFQSSTFNGTGFVLANAGQQSTTGIEFDSVYRATDEWTVTLAGTFLDPIYDSFVGGSGVDGPVDLSGERPAGIHEKSIVAGLTYNFEMDNGMYGYVRTDYLYESEVRLVANVPADLTREVSTFNASAGLNLENGLMFQIWVRNLNNDEYFLSAFPPPIQAGSFNAYPNQPRTFGASVTYDF